MTALHVMTVRIPHLHEPARFYSASRAVLLMRLERLRRAHPGVTATFRKEFRRLGPKPLAYVQGVTGVA